MIVQPYTEKIMYLKSPERRRSKGADSPIEKIDRLRPQAVVVIKIFLLALPRG